MEISQDLQIPLEDIRLATNNFSAENLIGRGGFGNVYEGILPRKEKKFAIKRLDRRFKQGENEFGMEIHILSSIKHENMITLVGFCNENEECILVYELAEYRGLDKYLSNNELSWSQRLKISIGAARCFCYIHKHPMSVLHRDIKSSNLLLNENWEVKVSDFGLSKIMSDPIVITNPCGTLGYVDPQYEKHGILTKESDVYSFGVVLFEILCGKKAYLKDENEGLILCSLAKKCYEERRLDEIIHPSLRNDQKDIESVKIFSKVAYRCLNDDRSKRPDMSWILEHLEKALELQENGVDRSILIGTCGKQKEGNHGDFWSYKLKENHLLTKIIIYHDDNAVNSLMFTSESAGVPSNPKKVGGLGGHPKEVSFESDEILICLKGTVVTLFDPKVISSLSFVTNKRTSETYGGESGSKFCIPLENGCFNGFYGFADSYIRGIGVYVKPGEEIMNIGPWGGKGVENRNPRNWYLPLERNQSLYRITVRRGDQIYALKFTTKQGRNLDSPGYFGGWNGGGTDEEDKFEWDEEIRGIYGTYGLSVKVQNEDQITVLTSISFVTNKRCHGPFGKNRGTPFAVECDYGEFIRLYGICGFYIDCIGVHLKTRTSKTLS